MAESTPLRDHALPATRAHEGEKSLRGVREKLKLSFVRTVFWSYERGTWQYDLIVLAILAFIFPHSARLVSGPPHLATDRPSAHPGSG